MIVIIYDGDGDDDEDDHRCDLFGLEMQRMRRHDVVVLIFFIYVSIVALKPIGDAEGA